MAEDHALYFEKGNERDLQKRLEEVLAHPEQTQKAHHQYSVSSASFSAMLSLCIKSILLCAFLLSAVLAPMLVP